MKAFVCTEYGNPDVLQWKDVEKPVPREGEVLLQLRAVSLNASDIEFLTGKPGYIRMWGLFRPRAAAHILGSDIAGQVVALGAGVQDFQLGEDVYADNMYRWGGLAQFVCVPAKVLRVKPAHLSFEDAAALPQAAVVALQALRDKGRLGPGQKVLINGAGGGSGCYALQLARLMGATVTGVDRTNKLELMRSIGACHVVDFTREDFRNSSERYDLVVDFVAKNSIFDWNSVLASGGRYVMVGGSVPRLLRTFFYGPFLGMIHKKKFGVLAAEQNKKEDLKYLEDLSQRGQLKSCIDRTYPLNQANDALRFLMEGRALGKVMIAI